jgi:hypothetical protein
MKTRDKLSRIDDALFVLAIAIPTLFMVARYVESAAQQSALILAHHAQHMVVANARIDDRLLLAQAGDRRSLDTQAGDRRSLHR